MRRLLEINGYSLRWALDVHDIENSPSMVFEMSKLVKTVRTLPATRVWLTMTFTGVTQLKGPMRRGFGKTLV